MATQEFATGGFIGKLGEVVGQHWKNKRYVRKYVVPYDPKTPAQLADRREFARCIHLAQAALALNRDWSLWERPDLTEFQAKTSTARRRLISNGDFLGACPALPDTFQVPIYYQTPTITIDYNAGHLEIDASPPRDIRQRTVMIVASLWEPKSRKFHSITQNPQTLQDGRIFTSIFFAPIYEPDPDNFVVAITVDNASDFSNLAFMPAVSI